MSEEKKINSNPVTAQPGWPAVVVGGAYYTAINLMRNLARRGVKVYCFDHGQNRQAFSTVYGKAFLCPDPDKQPAAWLDFMLDLAKKVGGKPVLIPSADAYVTALVAHAAKLSEAYLFCRENMAVLGKMGTKREQYAMAAQYGMPIPRTRFVNSAEEVRAFGAEAMFPCLIKPIRSYDWAKIPRDHPLARSKVAIADSLRELEDKYRIVSEIDPEAVVQELIEGPPTSRLAYLSCYSLDGRRIARGMVQVLRSVDFGSPGVVQPFEDPQADEVCDRFLRNMAFKGLCEIEVKRDIRDGIVKMIEANPRYTGISNATPGSGVDLGWVHYLDLIGQKVEMVTPTGRKFRHIALTWDAKILGNYLRSGRLTWRELVESYRPPVELYDLDFRDWRVAAKTLFTVVYLLFGRPIRKFFSKSYQY